MSQSKFVYVTFIRTTPEKLFDALRLPEFTRAYWSETWQDCDWKKGAPWKLMIPDGRLGDSGEVLEFDPPRRFAVSWRNEFKEDVKEEGYSRATFELEPVGDAVKLTVTHEIERENSKLVEAVSGGWPPLLSSLKSLLETGVPLAFTTKWPKGM
ncbi:MAG: SRPBCC family protein [Rhizomicrobium sp.]